MLQKCHNRAQSWKLNVNPCQNIRLPAWLATQKPRRRVLALFACCVRRTTRQSILCINWYIVRVLSFRLEIIAEHTTGRDWWPVRFSSFASASHHHCYHHPLFFSSLKQEKSNLFCISICKFMISAMHLTCLIFLLAVQVGNLKHGDRMD